MAAPIEMIRGGERQTVYSAAKLALAEADGWKRVADLTPEQQAELATRPAAPWRGYDDMNIEQILARVTGLGLNSEWRAKVLAYELSSAKPRKGIIEGLGGTAQPPVTVETVVEKPLETIETVEIVPAEDAPSGDA